jgi:hypothetical protein
MRNLGFTESVGLPTTREYWRSGLVTPAATACYLHLAILPLSDRDPT